MFSTVNLSRANPIIADVQKVAHGLSFPGALELMAIYVNPFGVFTPADASAIGTCKAVFVTEIYDVDNIQIQTSGFVYKDTHGLTIGEYYYLTDTGDGSFSDTPGTVNDVSFYVFDDNYLILIDNRPI